MLRMKLTKRTVDALQSDGDERRIWDTDIAGFGVRCRGATGKYYFLKYRLPNGRQRWATIGRHGSPWTVETARKEARRLLGQIVDGEDPVETKAIERTDLTVSQLCDLYLAQPIIITNRPVPQRRRPRWKLIGAASNDTSSRCSVRFGSGRLPAAMLRNSNKTLRLESPGLTSRRSLGGERSSQAARVPPLGA